MQASISTYSFNSSATNCIPDLPVIANANAHYYDDVEKFAVCLPTKTGSTNWLKFFYSLSIDHNSDPDDLDGAIIYSIPEMPRPRDELNILMFLAFFIISFSSLKHPISNVGF